MGFNARRVRPRLDVLVTLMVVIVICGGTIFSWLITRKFAVVSVDTLADDLVKVHLNGAKLQVTTDLISYPDVSLNMIRKSIASGISEWDTSLQFFLQQEFHIARNGYLFTATFLLKNTGEVAIVEEVSKMVMLGNATGLNLHVANIPAGTYNHTKAASSPLNVFKRPYYTLVDPAKDEIIWTPVSVNANPAAKTIGLAAFATRPLYAPNGQFWGIVSIGADLLKVDVSVYKVHEESIILVMDSDMKIVFCSILPVIAIETTPGVYEQYTLLTAPDDKLNTMGDYLLSTSFKTSELSTEIKINGATWLLHTAALPCSSWCLYIVHVTPKAAFHAEIDRGNKINMWLIVSFAILAGVIGFVTILLITLPIRKVAKGLKLMSKLHTDDDSNSVPDNSIFSELNTLYVGYKSLENGIDAFSRYVPRELVQLLLEQTKCELGVKPAPMTIMFVDIQGFTTLCNQYESHEVFPMLNRYFELCTDIIQQCNGTVDKYIGDGVMAFWNAPVPVENHEAAACIAALRILEAMSQEHYSTSNHAVPYLNIRCGVHTGEVFVGNIGSPHRYNYTVLGDAVNLASRLEGLGKRYGCSLVMSETVVQAVQQNSKFESRFIFCWLEDVVVKGYTDPVSVFELLADTEMTNTDACAHFHTKAATFNTVRAHMKRRAFAEALEILRSYQEYGHSEAAAILIEMCRNNLQKVKGGLEPVTHSVLTEK